MTDFDYKMTGIADRIKFAREGADVERVHCTRGIRPYPVGTHSFNMVTMLLIIWPEAPRELIIACIQHDIPERLTGDMPSFAKRIGVQNTEMQEHIETHVLNECFGHDYCSSLTPELQAWQYGLDMLEFYCWVKDECSLGNYSLSGKLRDVEAYFAGSYRKECPKPIFWAYRRIFENDWIMMPDKGGR